MQVDVLGFPWDPLFGFTPDRKKLEGEPKALQDLRKACGAELELKDGTLEFCGDKAVMPKLKAALQGVILQPDTPRSQ